jgi:sulfur relay protein TusB/DsrH
MNILYLWQKPNWRDFPSTLLDATDTCVLIGDGVLATLLSTEKPTLPCSLFILAADLTARQITLQPDASVIDDAKWLQLVLDHSKIVSF